MTMGGMRKKLRMIWWILRGRSVAYRIDIRPDEVGGQDGGRALMIECRVLPRNRTGQRP